jgi:hypothetical protein
MMLDTARHEESTGLHSAGPNRAQAWAGRSVWNTIGFPPERQSTAAGRQNPIHMSEGNKPSDLHQLNPSFLHLSHIVRAALPPCMCCYHRRLPPSPPCWRISPSQPRCSLSTVDDPRCASPHCRCFAHLRAERLSPTLFYAVDVRRRLPHAPPLRLWLPERGSPAVAPQATRAGLACRSRGCTNKC